MALMDRPQHPFRLAAGMATAACLLLACTVQPPRNPQGTLPEATALTVQERELAEYIYSDLLEDYTLDESGAGYYRLLHQFSSLLMAAGVNPDDWRVYLFDAPDVVDIRAIPGNTLLVWSGVFGVVQSDDELAGLLACEVAHGLARHTDPVEFGLGSELLFGMSDIAASVGIMVLTQGVVAVSGMGMTRWLYVEAADHDALDRVYSEQQREEMAEIALLLLAGAGYSSAGLLQFWQRAGTEATRPASLERLQRKQSPAEHVALLQQAQSRLDAMRPEAAVDNGVAQAYPGEPAL